MTRPPEARVHGGALASIFLPIPIPPPGNGLPRQLAAPASPLFDLDLTLHDSDAEEHLEQQQSDRMMSVEELLWSRDPVVARNIAEQVSEVAEGRCELRNNRVPLCVRKATEDRPDKHPSTSPQVRRSNLAGDVHAVGADLATRGHRVAVFLAEPQLRGGLLRAGHQCLLVLPAGHPDTELVVDVRFREQFAVPFPSAAYAKLLRSVPETFVGTRETLRAVLNLLCRELERTFESHGASLPPWRRKESVLGRWPLDPGATLLEAREQRFCRGSPVPSVGVAGGLCRGAASAA